MKVHLNTGCSTPKPVRRHFYLYNKGNFENLRSDLKEFGVKFLQSLHLHTVDEIWICLKSTLNSLTDKYVPSKLTSSRFNLPWFSLALRRQNNKLQRLYNRQRKTQCTRDTHLFKNARKTYKKNLNNAHRQYVSNMLDEDLQHNPKKFWKYVKSKRTDSTGVHPLKDGSCTVSDNKGKANILNSFFKSVFTQESNANITNLDQVYPDIEPLVISTSGIQKLLHDINPSKASGPYNIPNRSSELAPLLSALFNQSINTGELPSDWTTANVSPVFKKGSRSNPCNYRPISLTSVLCKTLEHVIHRHIMFHLEQHDILTDNQHGFRKRRSCDTQLLITINDIAKSVENRKQIDAILLDFSKAFDRVPHQRLLVKLRHYGITGNIYKWVSNFLTSRTQKVVLEGETSGLVDVISGVPQGTVLGPLLFLLYVNDISSHVSSKMRLFADDGLLYREIKSPVDAALLQNDLDSLCRWESEWEMKFNQDKCFVMHMTTKKAPITFSYNINNKSLQTTTSNPYLGVILSSDCSWSHHINKITTNAKQTVGIIPRNFKSCSRDVKSRLYQSLVRPKLEYAVCAWAPYTEEENKQLEGIQRSAARMCCNNYNRTSSVTTMLQDLGWPLLESRRVMTRLVMLYKITHGLVDVDSKPNLTIQTRTFRRSHQFSYYRVHAKSKIYSTSFFPSTIPHWNNLPLSVINAPNLNLFKSAAVDFLFNTNVPS